VDGFKAQFRVLVVGTGSIGERHVRCFQKTGRASIAIVEPESDRCMQVAGRYDVQRVFASLDHAWPHAWDAAVIATPAPTHIPIARTLASTGTHLLIEKPLSTSFDGIDELQDLTSRRNLVAMVGYVLRAHPVLQRLHDVINSGQLGDALQLVVVSGQHFPTFRPAYREIYYARRAAGGGAIQDALTHLLNAGEWILGPIERIVGDASHQALEGVNVEDTVHVIARHGPVLASYALNQYQAPNETTFTIVCSRGTVRAELHESRLRIMKSPNGNWTEERFNISDRDQLYILQANSFLDAIEHGRPVLCDLQQATQTLRVTSELLRQIESDALALPLAHA
jgi:predicted dehydrogenase